MGHPGLHEGYGLYAGYVEAFTAADVLAAEDVVGADHVALSLGEAGSVTLVGVAWELSLLAADEPSDLVFAGLAAVRAGHGVGSLLGPFVEKFTFFHAGSLLDWLRAVSLREILAMRLQGKVLHNQGWMAASRLGMAKAKKRVFSVVKAVKENARDRVGPVPAGSVIPDPKQKEAAKPKYKKTLADLLSGREES